MIDKSPVVVILGLILAGMAVYYAAILSGLIRGPLMARLRQYGEEYPLSMLTNMFISAGIAALLLSSQMPEYTHSGGFIRRTFPPWLFVLLGLASLGAAYVVYRQPVLRDALPRWYWQLLQQCSRQERRQIAYAWLRIPRLMRWRLSGDQKSFEVWAELVRLTVIYGAHDPNSAWDRWT